MIKPAFVYNLKKDTFQAYTENHVSPKAFLLAPNNATKSLIEFSEQIRKRRRGFFVDNGNFVQIGLIKKQFQLQANALFTKVRQFEEQTLGRSVRLGELPPVIQNEYRALATRVKQSCKHAVLDDPQMLAQQFSLNPTALIGTEDITMASWLSLNIERAYVNRSRQSYRTMNRKVATRAAKLIPQLPFKLRHRYYPVASAVSYNTAFDAGREFAMAGIRNISMGFGAYMADNNFVDHMRVGRKRVDFGANLPARYMRTVAAAKGFWQGYELELGKPPLRFHFLGLGAPIMLPLIALNCRRTKELTFDATSPIKDATRGGTLYIEKPAPLKVKTRKVAHRLARDDSIEWDCPCPFCTEFIATHPFDYQRARQWFKQHQPNKLTAKDLQPGSELFEAFPLLSEPKAHTELRQKINFTRIGHNHWVIDRILRSLRRADARRGLDKRVTNIVSKYTKHTSPQFAKAIGFSLNFVRQ